MRPKNFPFLSRDEFEALIRLFASRATMDNDMANWTSVKCIESDDGAILQICTPVQISEGEKNDVNIESPEDKDEFSEDSDPEVLDDTLEGGQLYGMVEYDIALSASYHVPVLYISIYDGKRRKIIDLGAIYQLLVPSSMTEELNNVGIVGGITTTYHPGTGTPTFFVHPCHTAEAMKALDVGNGAVDYLLSWFGFIGRGVGLHVPLSIAIRCRD